LLNDFDCKLLSSKKLYIGNQSSIKLIKNPEFHKRTKHIDIKFHFVREKVEDHVPVSKMRAICQQIGDRFPQKLLADWYPLCPQ